jgi:hypothetical protein
MENENDYLEMCDHFKKVVDDKDKCIKMLCVVNHEIKKEVLTAYGIVRLIDREISAIEDMPCNIKHLITDLRSHLSEFYDNLFPLPNNNGQDI